MSWLPLALGLLGPGAPAVATPPAPTPFVVHENDPKAQGRLPAYRGRGFRAAQSRRPQPTIAAALTPTSFPADGVALAAWLPLDELDGAGSGSDCWGYTAPSGREYALMTTSRGTLVVEISTPSDPQIIANIDGPDSIWRDVKTYQDHAYVVSEGGGDIQVLDLSQIDSGVVSLVNTVGGGGSSATHNVTIDTESGYLYRSGGSTNGIRIFSLADPANPVYLNEWDTRYVHDCQAITYTSGPNAGKRIVFACSGFNGGFDETAVDVLDVTDPFNIVNLSRESWPNAAYSHQCWLSPSGQYLYVNDELDETFNGDLTKTIILDVSNLNNIQYAGDFTNGLEATGHNLYVSGNQLFEANYRSGVRIFDVTNETNPTETAFFDTFPEGDDAPLNGLWNVYPFFPSGTVIGSDFERGLFVWTVGDGLSFDIIGGAPLEIAPSGQSLTINVTQDPPGSLVPGSLKLFYDAGNGTQSLDLVNVIGNTYTVTFPELPCGAELPFYLSGETTSGAVFNDPPTSSGEVYAPLVSPGVQTAESFDMESDDGWISGASGDDATTGIWTRGNPIGTESQPEDDNSANGTDCWFTGQGSVGGSLGEQDIDDGQTTLRTPVMNASGLQDPRVEYWRWYDNDGNSAVDDVFEVSISNTGGGNWTTVEVLGPEEIGTFGGWQRVEFRVAEFVTPTSQIQVRFIASDRGDGSIVEAAIDDFRLFGSQCPDCDNDGVADGAQIVAGTALDLDQNGEIDVCQELSALPGSLSVSAGGVQSFSLHAGAQNFGKLFFLLGSTSGTTPGTAVGLVNVPLNVDSYTFSTLVPNTPPLGNSFGVLGLGGSAAASFSLPANFDPNLAGLVVHHAYLILEGTGELIGASNPVSVTLVP
ncbi:MAG: choice-of-anchor B family protein [Planctomycetota bacterium]|jgi:choice-of-anchor B domain-containing protein